MKKLLTLAFVALSFVHADAQQKSHSILNKVGNRTLQQSNLSAQRGTVVTTGVLTPPSFGSSSPCLANISVYNFGGDYFAGNNSFGDKEVMQRYTLSEYGLASSATVDSVYTIFGTKYQSGNGNVRVKIYSATSNGTPGTLLGTSANKTVAQLDTVGITKFAFATPVAITTNQFFVSVDVSSLYATADTVALFSTDNSCATTDTMDAWTYASDNNFYAFSDADNNWGFGVDMAIFPNVTANTLGINNVVKNNFSANAYPVPANSTVTISFIGQDNGTTTLNLKDITGKTVATSLVKTVKGNTYKTPFAVGSLSSGMYFVEIASGNNKGMLKVAVQ